jgi:hypothetical protein
MLSFDTCKTFEKEDNTYVRNELVRKASVLKKKEFDLQKKEGVGGYTLRAYICVRTPYALCKSRLSSRVEFDSLREVSNSKTEAKKLITFRARQQVIVLSS